MWAGYSDYYILDPFPDELLYSTVARTFRLLNHTRRDKIAVKFHYRHTQSPLSIVPFYLFENPTSAFEHSIAPYYMSVFTLERQKELLTKFFKENGENLMGAFNKGISFSPFKKPMLSFCPRCLEDDIKNVGMPYFHLSHQYEGVTACPFHGNLLVEYSFRNDFRTFPLLKPDDYTEVEQASDRELKYSRWALEFKNYSHEYLKAVYHSKVLEVDPKLRNVNYLFNALESYFGVGFLKKVDCLKEGLTRGRRKIAGLLSYCNFSTHPYYHFMLWEFLRMSPEDFKRPILVIKGKYSYHPVSDSILNLNSNLLSEDLGVKVYSVQGLPKEIYEYFPLDLNNYSKGNF